MREGERERERKREENKMRERDAKRVREEDKRRRTVQTTITRTFKDLAGREEWSPGKSEVVLRQPGLRKASCEKRKKTPRKETPDEK